VTVSPNPFSDVLRLRVELSDANEVKLTLFDQADKVVIEQELSGTSGSNSIDLNTQTLANGLYYLSIESNNGVEIRIVVKQQVFGRR
jgi:hypothetical protein